ncbi:MAG: hypothetical protein P4M11_02205 [Candidatus Pacebacteria bacterium]|nr:hypothetical protein [Candidatus Paceibacterota bacterium]
MAFNRSTVIAFELIKNFYRIQRLKKTVLQYSDQGTVDDNATPPIVKVIQEHWRNKVKLDLGRKEILIKKWDMRVRELLRQYKEKGKRYSNIAWKVKNIPAEKRDEIMKRYYNSAKKKYLDALVKWLRKRACVDKAFPLFSYQSRIS